MKPASIMYRIAMIAGLSLGAFAIAAFADWTAPLSAPPTCIAGNPGCDAPINVGNLLQQKSGPLQLNNSLGVLGTFILGSTNPSFGKVLMSIDSMGTAAWVATSSLGLGGGSGGNPVTTAKLHTSYYNASGVASGMSLGVHDYCGFQTIKYGYNTIIGDSSMWLNGSSGSAWSYNYSGHTPDNAGVLCLDLY